MHAFVDRDLWFRQHAQHTYTMPGSRKAAAEQDPLLMHLHDLRLFGALLERPLGLVVFVHYLTTFSEGSCGVYRGFSVKNNCDWGHKRKGNVEGVVHPQAGVGQSVWNGGWTLNRSVRVTSRGAAARGVPAPGSATRFRPRPVGGCPASQVVGRPEIRVRPNARIGIDGRVLSTVRRPERETVTGHGSGQTGSFSR